MTLATSILVGGLAACGSITPQMVTASLAPVEAAIARDPAALRAEADAGRADAQYALSIALEHGLRGLPKNAEEAALYRRKALASRGFMPITTYIAGLNGKPGRVAMINVPRHEFSGVQSVIVQRCVEKLSQDIEGPSAAKDCGGEANFQNLRRLWRQAS